MSGNTGDYNNIFIFFITLFFVVIYSSGSGMLEYAYRNNNQERNRNRILVWYHLSDILFTFHLIYCMLNFCIINFPSFSGRLQVRVILFILFVVAILLYFIITRCRNYRKRIILFSNRITYAFVLLLLLSYCVISLMQLSSENPFTRNGFFIPVTLFAVFLFFSISLVEGPMRAIENILN